ncbi:MAG: ATP-dependent helicase HrpB, partial [Myxococcales bacterium]|nr:ATP-dependent helicase HrpB [Myxococcales bacterium]
MALPITAQLPDLVATLSREGAAVVVAPPGTGKSTQIPPAIAATGRKTLVVQPRRVAARALARRVAQEQQAILGEGVGYHVRFDRCASPRTAIEYVTDGILLRRLLREPELPGVGAVVLDEFHERSVNMDLLLALLAEVRSTLREDLWFVAMSATLDAEPLANYLGGAPILRSEAPLYPLAIDFSPPRDDDQPLPERCAKG